VRPETVAPLAFFIFLTLVIIVPIWLRNRLYGQQLDVIAKAIEKGIDPERINLKLPARENDSDINGNWKAGLIMIAVGLVFGLVFVLPMYANGELGPKDVWPVMMVPCMVIAIGLTLIYVHHAVVGKVYRQGEPRPSLRNGHDGAL
jgi:tetrahydromethanopterin S-methyltransferase subunit B